MEGEIEPLDKIKKEHKRSNKINGCQNPQNS